jgi:HEAT repeat protein
MIDCPICGKPVDPLRAPAVRVNAGKVVPYCSKECASMAETQPVRTQPAQGVRPATEPGQTKGKARTPASGVPKVRSDLESGPVIQIVHEPGSGVVTSAVDARSTRARSNPRAETDGAIQIADTGHIDDFVSYDEAPRRRGLLVVLLLLLVVAGGGAAAYYLGYLDKYLGRDKPVAATKAVETPKPPEIDALVITPEMALERAKDVLRTQIKSNSPRVQRVAASALARTSDPEAIEVLAAALGKEASETGKLDIAYALARGGDTRGDDALMVAAAGNREQRHDAGRRFAMLRDKRAIRTLQSSLEYTQFRLGVAEHLAYLSDPRALKVLDDVRNDEKATPDDKARATIALGHAGRADIAPALRELLADDRNNAFAAIALAELHDESARAVLVKQLTIPSLRVQAARALRRLAPDANLMEHVLPLLDALDSNKDTEQVQIAEAILLLAGPATWSERE